MAEFCDHCPKLHLMELIEESRQADADPVFRAARVIAHDLLELTPCLEGPSHLHSDGEDGYDLDNCGNANAGIAETILSHTKLGLERDSVAING